MEYYSGRKIFGFSLVLTSGFLLIVNRLTDFALADYVGRQFCGEEFLRFNPGQAIESACGFNVDMYLSALLVMMLILGLITLGKSVNK